MSGPDSCPTVKIVSPKVKGNQLGFVEINESDFDTEKHERFVEAPETDEEKAAREADEQAARDAAQALADQQAAADAEAAKNAPGAPDTPAQPTGWGEAPSA